MSKKKKRQASSEQKPPVSTKQPPSTLKEVVKWISIGVLICTLLSGAMTFASILTVEAGAPQDASNPFSSSFIVGNNMIVPLFGVTIACKYHDVEFEGGGTLDNNAAGSEETFFLMASYKKITAPCPKDINMTAPMKSGIVTIAVSYSPFLWPFKTSTIRHFKTELAADKKILWLPQ
ncbi:MAG: hypothetical protein CAF45_004245 [Nitrospira sp. CG24E]|nr:MAG: hypothetical protein CAF45_004245 [Nitrospira sp. CG24E]